jgi:hypothetical protein
MNQNVYTQIENGRVTVGTSAVQMTTTSVETRQGVTLIAYSGNVGSVHVGKSGLTTSTGFPLKPNVGITIPIDDPSKVWAISQTAGNFLHWILV